MVALLLAASALVNVGARVVPRPLRAEARMQRGRLHVRAPAEARVTVRKLLDRVLVTVDR